MQHVASVSAAAPARLEITGLTRLIEGRAIVDQVSLRLRAGQITCLLGPSGCGKSTTLRMVAGVERPDAGAVHVDGTVLSDSQTHIPPEQRSIGLMFQDFALFPHLTVLRNVAFGLTGRRQHQTARATELLERVGLAHYAENFPHELSGGEQQRVALARALAPKPRIMLMDEPFSGLDNRLRDGIRDETLALLKEEGTAVLLVTHEPDEAMRMADEIALMRDGAIVQQGAPYQVYTYPVDKDAAAFFSDINVLRAEVRGGFVETAFGGFLTPGLGDGDGVEIVVRPQHLTIDFDRAGVGPVPSKTHGVPARGIVQRARFMGSESLVEFRMDHDGSLITATVPNVFLPKPGHALWLSLRRDRCHVFPAEA
ncbi:ABC transporter ATP-binding protein [Actibacterium sp. 188UL27-1]|uniref:ABC transporter ATP-binding protein n=1 Tax=Actibacterium sp. 188UL27-1 TaxID=2786961 RepID=UPI00195AC295|nr:ABC transporter ATP-binding protein [Actibacterium sp. 188UL27-1]MBM7067875.1 ABC transporter ATP-binding protein [Actibacterium sp. 188UL27-1]